MKNKVVIIIVNWNGLKFLQNCLNSVFNQSYRYLEVYFVDNGSQDESISFVKENYPQTNIISLKHNTGFAKGNNEGIKEALKDKEVKYIVCLNNDTIVDDNWLEELVVTAEKDKKIGSVSSKAYFDDRKTIQNAGLRFCKSVQCNQKGGASIGYGLTDFQAPELSKDKEVFSSGGVASLYKKEVLEKILQRDKEIFDEDFFAYIEDYDLGCRIRSIGYISFLSSNAHLVHLHSRTGGVASSFKSFYSERNSILTVIKNFPLVDLILFPFRNVILKISYIWKKHESVEKLKENIGLFKMALIVFQANFEALLLIPKMLIKRYNIMKK